MCYSIYGSHVHVINVVVIVKKVFTGLFFVIPRPVEDGVLQCQKVGEDVEGLEEEALGSTSI